MARPHKITPDIEKKLLQLIQAGVAKHRAAQACGIAESTLYLLQKNNESFRSAIEKAYAECVASKVLTIARAEKDGSWQAAAWWLERRERADYARVDRHEHSGKDGAPIEQNLNWKLDELPKHDLRELYRIQLAATNGQALPDESEEPVEP
jgi:homogentisate 1,2-dioxygenase